jgi:hypothetical protein
MSLKSLRRATTCIHATLPGVLGARNPILKLQGPVNHSQVLISDPEAQGTSQMPFLNSHEALEHRSAWIKSGFLHCHHVNRFLGPPNHEGLN